MHLTGSRFLIFIFLGSLFTQGTLSGQIAEIDSIQQIINSSTGTRKIDALNSYAFLTIAVDLKLADEALQKSLKLAAENDYTKGLAEANIYKGLTENLHGNPDSAFSFLRKGLNLANKAKESGLKGYALTQLGNVFRNTGGFDSAKYYYDQSYLVLKDSLNPWQLSTVYNHLSRLYKLTSQPKLEYEYLMRSYAIRKLLPDKVLLIDVLVNLASWHLDQLDLVKAKFYINQAEELNKIAKYPDLQNDIDRQQAVILVLEGKFKEALVLLNNVNEFYTKTGNITDYVRVTIHISEMLELLGFYDLSISKCLEAIKVCQEKAFKNEEIRAYTVLAWNYYGTDQIDAAKETVEKILVEARQFNYKKEESSALNLLAVIDTDIRKYDKALSEFQDALRIRTNMNHPVEIANTLANMSDLFIEMGRLDEAQVTLEKSNAIAEKMQIMRVLGWNYLRLGNIAILKKEFDVAVRYFIMAEQELNKNTMRTRDDMDLLIELYKSRRTILIARGDIQTALQHSLKLEALKDSLAMTLITNRMLSIQAAYQVNEQKHEIEMLTKSQQLQKDQIEIQNANLRVKNIIITTGLLGFIIMVILTIYIYKYYSKTRKLYLELQENNEEIQSQSEKLLEANNHLSLLNKNLVEKQQEVEKKALELTEANQKLIQLNKEIAEQSEEMAAQSEELTESNQLILNLNENLEKHVRDRTVALEQAYQELDTFFYRSSHDFRGPLSSLAGLAEVAKYTVKDLSALELFEKVKETTISFDRMLGKLQSISDVGSEHLSVKQISFPGVFEDVCFAFRKELSDAKINVQIKDSVTQVIVSYPAFIKTIVENVIENSIQFRSQDSPYIRLEAKEEGDGVEILISDNGIGIGQNYLENVTDMYFRSSEKSKGNGLGLYIVKKAVVKLKGQLLIESTPNKGTLVKIWLPRHI